MASKLLFVSFALAFAAACDHSHDEYATFQACFDEHTGAEGYTGPMAITICVLDHPIDGTALEFATVAECVAYVEANLDDASASTADITAGCEDYILQKDQ